MGDGFDFDFTDECRERVSEDLKTGESIERSLIGEPEGYDEIRLRKTKVGRLSSMATEQMATMFGMDRLLHGRRRAKGHQTALEDLEVQAPGEARQLAGKQLAVTLTDRRVLFHDLTEDMLPHGYIGSYSFDQVRLSSVSVVGGKRILEIVFADDTVLSLNCPLFQPVRQVVDRYDQLSRHDEPSADYGARETDTPPESGADGAIRGDR